MKQHKQISTGWKGITLALGLVTYAVFSPLAHAVAPVEDISEEVPLIQSGPSNVATSTRSLPVPQRIDKVERQLANQAQTLEQLNTLQQQLQDLRGQLEVQAHDIAQLKQQQSSMYQDLDKRMATTSSKETSPKKSANHEKNDADTAIESEEVEKNKKSNKTEESTDTTKVDTDKTEKTSDQDAYQSATKRITSKDYDGGLKAMKAYIKNYPDGHYVGNAYYWLGELYLLKNNSKAATTAFNTLITKYPDHAKVADAMLKLGNIYIDNGQAVKAKHILTKVKTNYAGTAAARLAADQLKTLKSKEPKATD